MILPRTFFASITNGITNSLKLAKHRVRYLPTTLASLLILVAVMLPGAQVPDVNIVGIDKVAHFSLFFVWALGIRRDFGTSFRWPVALVAGLAFSWLTEILQIAVEGRTFDWTDIVADAVGLIFGIIVGRLVLQWLSRFRAR
jgi:VanZ family protein